MRETKRVGLLALYQEAGIPQEEIGTYEVNYVIAPRLNAAGRLEQAFDSLRLICTLNKTRARALAVHLGVVNSRRQRLLEEITLHAKKAVGKIEGRKVLVLAHETYHEGVIGLAAARLVEEFYLPAIVIAKGKQKSKGSARSIAGFDMFAALSRLSDFPMSWGGHKMAAGFTLKTRDIETFAKRFADASGPLLGKEVLTRRLKIDAEIELDWITKELWTKIEKFDPTGVGNPAPSFVTRKVQIAAARPVGRDGSHLKLALAKKEVSFGGIAFGFGSLSARLVPGQKADIVYCLSLNEWNGRKEIELKIKDIRI